MKARTYLLGAALAAGLSLTGCYTLNKTAGRCDCDPPPVETLLQEPALPPHFCAPPNHLGPYVPAAPRMHGAGEPPVVVQPPVVVNPPAPKVIEGKKLEK